MKEEQKGKKETLIQKDVLKNVRMGRKVMKSLNVLKQKKGNRKIYLQKLIQNHVQKGKKETLIQKDVLKNVRMGKKGMKILNVLKQKKGNEEDLLYMQQM